MKHSSSPRAMFAALAFGAGALLTVVPTPAAAIAFAPTSLRLTSSAACTVKSQFTVLKTIGGSTNGDTFQVTQLDGGAFRGANGARTANVTGYLRGTTFQLTSQGASGYNYSLDGMLDERTGTISGRGSDSDGQRFTFTIRDGVTCTGAGQNTGATPPVMHDGNNAGGHDDKNKADKNKADKSGKPSKNQTTRDDQDSDSDDSDARRAGRCRSSSAVATSYLRSMGERPNQRTRTNIVSRVARNTRRNGSFNGVPRCDDRYRDEVRRFVDNQLAAR